MFCSRTIIYRVRHAFARRQPVAAVALEILDSFLACARHARPSRNRHGAVLEVGVGEQRVDPEGGHVLDQHSHEDNAEQRASSQEVPRLAGIH